MTGMNMKEIVSSWRGPWTFVLVTHGFTIRPLIGIILGQAETAVLSVPSKPSCISGVLARPTSRR